MSVSLVSAPHFTSFLKFLKFLIFNLYIRLMEIVLAFVARSVVLDADDDAAADEFDAIDEYDWSHDYHHRADDYDYDYDCDDYNGNANAYSIYLIVIILIFLFLFSVARFFLWLFFYLFFLSLLSKIVFIRTAAANGELTKRSQLCWLIFFFSFSNWFVFDLAFDSLACTEFRRRLIYETETKQLFVRRCRWNQYSLRRRK